VRSLIHCVVDGERSPFLRAQER
jgi:hypothetical protein